MLLIGVVGCTSTSIDERYKDEKTREIEEKRYQDYVAKAKIKAIEGQKRLDALLKTTNKETLPKKTIKREQEEKKMAVIHALKERCISYGFTGSNNIAACVQREAQHDYEIEQKEYELQLTKQQLLAQQNQQQVAPQVPWYLSILEGVAEGIAEGYKQQALIQTMDSRYEKKDIYRYRRPNC